MALTEQEYTAAEGYSDYSATETVSTFGGELSMFGATLTPEILNDPAFSVVFDADVGAGILQSDVLTAEVFFSLEFGSPDTSGHPFAESGLQDCCIGQADRVVVVGKAGTIKTTDDLGKTWTTQESPVAESLRCVMFESGEYVTGGDNGVILTSSDADTWTQEDSQTTESILSIARDKKRGVLLASGDEGAIRKKSSGSLWNRSRN